MVSASRLRADAAEGGGESREFRLEGDGLEVRRTALGDELPPTAPSEGTPGTTPDTDVVYKVPLPFGEQLVLETYLRCKRRPYSRSRQEELAKPRRKGASARNADALIAAAEQGAAAREARRLDSREADCLVKRLAKPKRPHLFRKAAEGDAVVQQAREAERAKRADFDLDAMVRRLAAPPRRPLSPSAADRMVMQHGNAAAESRPVDLQRIAALARATRRGGSCRAWGVRPEDFGRRDSFAPALLDGARAASGTPGGRLSMGSYPHSPPSTAPALNAERATAVPALKEWLNEDYAAVLPDAQPSSRGLSGSERTPSPVTAEPTPRQQGLRASIDRRA